MQFYVRSISNHFLRFLYGFFVQMPLEIYWRFLTAYVPTSAVFINYTSATDLELHAQWTLAQQGLANASFPLTCSENGPMHAAVPAALTVVPKHVTVVSVPDITPGAIVTPDMTQEPCHSFACCWKKGRVYAAESKVPVTLAYEMQNLILSQLGIDVSQR
jgi:hypothetical protein